ncbi:MAG: hypothetical protein ACYCX2_02465 [Christensenellales bacterium]
MERIKKLLRFVRPAVLILSLAGLAAAALAIALLLTAAQTAPDLSFAGTVTAYYAPKDAAATITGPEDVRAIADACSKNAQKTDQTASFKVMTLTFFGGGKTVELCIVGDKDNTVYYAVSGKNAFYALTAENNAQLWSRLAKYGITPLTPSAIPSPTPLIPFEIPTPTPAPAGDLVRAATLDLYLGGQRVHGLTFDDAASKKVIMDAIFNGMIKSYAERPLDTAAIEDRIEISIDYIRKEPYEHSEYFVFEMDGKTWLQMGRNDMRVILNDEVVKPLRDLAMGYSQPYALTVKSGDQAIYAMGRELWSQPKGGVRSDEPALAPQTVAGRLQTLVIAPHRETMTPFDAYAGGRKTYGGYTLYDKDFNTVEYFLPSGLEPQTYLFQNAKPGSYIVEFQTAFETADRVFGCQYFFAVEIR